MDDTEIGEIIARLDQSQSESAKSRIEEGKPARYLFLVANRVALIRFASAFLKAAVSPIPEDNTRSRPASLAPGHEQIADDRDKDYLFGFAQRMETWPERADLIENRTRKAKKRDRIALMGCGVFAFVILFFLVSGFSYWISIILGKP